MQHDKLFLIDCKVKSFNKITLTLAALTFCVSVLSFSALGQSRDQNFPTPVTTNEIDGTIRARDVGDSRLTSYYYVFDGGQGDIFINVVSRNFSGDIDVYLQDSLRPLTKMVIYADAPDGETGRLIYLRKSERLILRVQGRTPNDNQATFRIKFAGSFVAVTGVKSNEAPSIETSENSEPRRVNSVGTIIGARPKPLPPIKTAEAIRTVEPVKQPIADDENEKPAKPDIDKTETKMVVVVEDNLPKTPVEAAPKVPAAKPVEADSKSITARSKGGKPVAARGKKPDPLAGIRLIIQLKDGSVIERPMTEVSRFSVIKGVLVVIAKGGKATRHSLLDVEKVTIQ